METKNAILRWPSLIFLSILLLTGLPGLMFLLPGCEFHPGTVPEFCARFQDLPVTPLAPVPNPTVVLEDLGRIQVLHGFGRASAFLHDGKDYIKVEQGVPIPDYANQATVFLNGWKVDYSNGDENVLELGVAITKIKLDRGRLTWNAFGILRDNDGAEAIDFYYYYTVIAWNTLALNLIIDQGDPDHICSPGTNFPANAYYAHSNGRTALSSYHSFILNPSFPPNRPVAVLPRGFGFGYTGGDHDLLQLAYNLDHSEILVRDGKRYDKGADNLVGAPLPNPPAGHMGSGFVSWNTYAIFKDNGDNDFIFGEIVSALGGNDVAILQPPFSILPRKAGDNHGGGGVKSERFTIENIPYQYAIPMLTGWDLHYDGDDHNVREVGITIDGWLYSGGTLTYYLSSILRDDDMYPRHQFDHKVTVLGIGPVMRGPGTERTVPGSP
jgi:hypothetical protein